MDPFGMGSMNDPSAWPHAAEEMSREFTQELSRRGWWPALIAAFGSIATIGIGGALMLARRRKRSGILAAMPSHLAEASEQMLRAQMQMRGRSGGSAWRTILGIAAFAAAGWGIRRTFSHA